MLPQGSALPVFRQPRLRSVLMEDCLFNGLKKNPSYGVLFFPLRWVVLVSPYSKKSAFAVAEPYGVCGLVVGSQIAS